MYALQNPIFDTDIPELRLNGISGYSILGDRITLNIGEVANHRSFGNLSGTLSVELWALNQAYQGGSFSGIPLAGVVIGELHGQHAIGPASWELAFQEPGEGCWQLTLMLREWNGVAYETRDFVNFAAPYSPVKTAVRQGTNNVIEVSFIEYKHAEASDSHSGRFIENDYFVQAQAFKPAAAELLLLGNCGYDVQNGRIRLNVGEIANRRGADNVSGTLVLELWALDQAYQGGHFDGFAVAGVRVGELAGRQGFRELSLETEFCEPPVGRWHLSLMLREWNGVAYETRDCINFAVPYTVTPKPVAARKESDNVINVQFGESKKAAVTPVEPVALAGGVSASRASINQATLDELGALKGVPKKTVENIVAAQPFASFDDLSNVKGVGPKLLKLLRELFAL
ncbi:helix-hairpin-helix domain-containing protein [Methylomonas sp. UP202]|uniref:helix-hairpin-helix domain-containing protein n=1 Tax=Methylomonas sp. UP202 TaxID=3040943 RepID=UPI002478A90B|nr:helix-hairpin-helix domain-containing protein [Methylomonas sp. UP202]WGS84943.1 helix-hairpin-helix domain-containing protein [Methylomonas sp. UP202]